MMLPIAAHCRRSDVRRAAAGCEAATAGSKLMSTPPSSPEAVAWRSFPASRAARWRPPQRETERALQSKRVWYALGQSDRHSEERCRQHAERCGLVRLSRSRSGGIAPADRFRLDCARGAWTCWHSCRSAPASAPFGRRSCWRCSQSALLGLYIGLWPARRRCTWRTDHSARHAGGSAPHLCRSGLAESSTKALFDWSAAARFAAGVVSARCLTRWK